jgi:hypothetical protein
VSFLALTWNFGSRDDMRGWVNAVATMSLDGFFPAQEDRRLRCQDEEFFLSQLDEVCAWARALVFLCLFKHISKLV